jgi:hypothetical protein
MTLIIVIAAVGWVLFLLAAVLYVAGNRLNAEESHALAVYSLALLLSDEFRDANRNGFEAAIREGRSKGVETQAVIYGLMQGVTQNAKRYYKGKNQNLDTLALVMDYVSKVV